MYWMLVKPSARRKLSATHKGAWQMETFSVRRMRIVVVSSPPLAALGVAGRGPQASSKLSPAAVRAKPPAAFKSWRRLSWSTILAGDVLSLIQPSILRSAQSLFGLPRLLEPDRLAARHGTEQVAGGGQAPSGRGRGRQLGLKLFEERPISALLDDLIGRAVGHLRVVEQQ